MGHSELSLAKPEAAPRTTSRHAAQIQHATSNARIAANEGVGEKLATGGIFGGGNRRRRVAALQHADDSYLDPPAVTTGILRSCSSGGAVVRLARRASRRSLGCGDLHPT